MVLIWSGWYYGEFLSLWEINWILRLVKFKQKQRLFLWRNWGWQLIGWHLVANNIITITIIIDLFMRLKYLSWHCMSSSLHRLNFNFLAKQNWGNSLLPYETVCHLCPEMVINSSTGIKFKNLYTLLSYQEVSFSVSFFLLTCATGLKCQAWPLIFNSLLNSMNLSFIIY